MNKYANNNEKKFFLLMWQKKKKKQMKGVVNEVAAFSFLMFQCVIFFDLCCGNDIVIGVEELEFDFRDSQIGYHVVIGLSPLFFKVGRCVARHQATEIGPDTCYLFRRNVASIRFDFFIF